MASNRTWPRALIYALALSCCLGACGRFGVVLLPGDAGRPHDAGRSQDAGAHDAAAYGGGADAGDSCHSTCANPHGSASCSGGDCSVSCAIGYADCDGRGDNGCEVDVTASIDSCGTCDTACQNAHGQLACSAGVCKPSCSTGFADCNSDPKDGCESDLASVNSCGACGVACKNDHGSTACAAGTCSPTCSAAFADCDGEPKNGCETNVSADPMHCGSCTMACGTNGQICQMGSCAASPCSAGLGECDGDLSMTCETNLETSVDNCGFCGNMCMLDHAMPGCSNGSCSIAACTSGYGDCDAAAANGCETDLASTTAHCGACETACSNDHGSTSCAAAICNPVCSSGFGDCDGNELNGCETDLGTTANCGKCGNSCPAATGGSPTCTAGVCGVVCNLTGTFAIKLQVAVTWPSRQWINSGSGTAVAWVRLQGTHSGNTFSGTLSDCGRTNPPFHSSFLSEQYQLFFPNTLFDHSPSYFANQAATVTLGSAAPGATFSLARVALLSGLSMSDPINNAWPSSYTGVTQVDMDMDSKVGITATYGNGSGNTYPPTSTSQTSRSDKPYIAARTVFSLGGTLTTCTQASGSASVTHVDTHVLGCHTTSGGTCSSSETSFFDNNHPQYSVSSASYTMLKVAGNASCADVRNALP